jgi:hypothetical protein
VRTCAVSIYLLSRSSSARPAGRDGVPDEGAAITPGYSPPPELTCIGLTGQAFRPTPPGWPRWGCAWCPAPAAAKALDRPALCSTRRRADCSIRLAYFM